MAKEVEVDNRNCANIIQTGTNIEGEIRTNGNIRIDGTASGTIKALGKVIIGAEGVVNGEIECGNAAIEGQCNVKITVKELLELKSTARFEGEISTSKLSIETGAIFCGICKMKIEDKQSIKEK